MVPKGAEFSDHSSLKIIYAVFWVREKTAPLLGTAGHTHHEWPQQK